MIDVKKTLALTIKDKFNRLRYLAENKPLIFKKILYLIILDDVYEWAVLRKDCVLLVEDLRQRRLNFIYNNTEFLTVREYINDDIYLNVNTPQDEYTWNRVYDNPDYIMVNNFIEVLPQQPTSFVPDPSCTILFVQYPTADIKENTDGSPLVDLNNLTTCEKMNIYLNRNTGNMYYLDTNCNWKLLSAEVSDGSITEEKLGFNLYKGIKHYVDPLNKTITVQLLTEDNPIDDGVQVVDENQLDDILI